MKKIITFIVLVISFAGVAQGVTITTNKTAIELINEVLISPTCSVFADNVSASTGNTSPFGSTNGIGYFSNLNPTDSSLPNNPNFPFKSGVVLSTGDVNKVPSPNNAVLSDGSTAWPGDTEMQTALAAQGVTINSINASYLQFEFIATTTTFSLNFIFASEEYGASQCNYSDAFAFLIKDVTVPSAPTAYINVATVPSPAIPGMPISVDNIRDATYNPNCSSVNEIFFGAYNGGGFGPAINFNGQTVPMTAITTLVVGRKYRVKLVIADGNNNTGYDSAIFLEAQTLNIGGEVLGIDYVSANAANGRTGVCPGGTFPTLQPETALPLGTTYKWQKYNPNNGIWNNISPANTTSSLDLNTLNAIFSPNFGVTSKYRIIYTRPGCQPIFDEIDVQSFPDINALVAIPPMYKCRVTGAANYNFAFDTALENTILNGNSGAVTEVTFHSSQTNADDNTNAVTDINIADPGAIGYDMFVRITKNTGCYETRSFKLFVVDPPTIVGAPLPLTACATAVAAVPRGVFDFTNNISLIRGSTVQNPDYNVLTFHLTQAGATNPTNNTTSRVTVNAMNNATLPTITVWARLQNASNPDCFVVVSFNVTVTPLAPVDVLPDVIVCDNFVLPTSTQPTSTYWSLTDGPSGGGVQYFANQVITAGATPKTIYVYNESGICKTNDSFKITKANLSIIAPPSSTQCQTDNYQLPGLPYGKYFKLAGGPSTLNQEEYQPGHISSTPGPNVYHVWFENLTETPACGQDWPFTITVTPFTNLEQVNYPNKFDCTSYTFNTPVVAGIKYYNGPNKSGGEITLPFTYSTANSQKTVYVYKESPTNANCKSEVSFTIFIGLTGGGFQVPQNVNECSPYTLPDLAFGEYRTAANGGGSIIPSGTVIGVGTTTIYYYVPGETCSSNVSFSVTIALPALDPIADVVVCDEYILPTIAGRPNGKYYYSSGGAGAPLLQGALIYNNTNLPLVQMLYFVDQSTTGPCYVEEAFQLTINRKPKISERPISVVRCNQTFVLDNLQFGEYYEFQGGPSASNPNPILPQGTVIATNNPATPGYKEIWVYSGSADPLNTCFQEYSIKIYFVNTTVTPIDNTTVCDSYTLPAIVGPGSYYPLSGGPLVPGNTPILPPYNVPSKLIKTTTTLYVYAEDNNRVACSDEDSFTVTVVRTPDLNPQISPVIVCDSYTIPQYNDPMFTFTATNPGVITKFYKNSGGAVANPLAADVYTPGQVITNTNADFSPKTITLYPYAELLGAPAPCFENEAFVVTINRSPVLAAVANVAACDTYELPVLAIGKYYPNAAHNPSEEWDTLIERTLIAPSTTVYVYAETGTTPNCAAAVQSFDVTISTTPVFTATEVADVFTCNSYILPVLSIPGANYYTAPNGPNGTGTLIPASQSYTNNVTVYAYAANAANPNCFANEEIVISIYNVAESLDISVCDSYQLPDLVDPNANYYTQPNKGGNLLPELSFITSSQTVYINGTFTPNSSCSDESSFDVTIVPTPSISPIIAVFGCDSYTIPAYSNPMFTSTNPITKFYKNPGGPANNLLATDEYLPNQIIPYPGVGTAPFPFTLYAYSAVGTVPCWDDEPFVVTINKAPVIVASEVLPVTRCDSYTLPALTIGNYVTSTGASLSNLTLTTTQTVYVRAINGVAPNTCVDNKNFLVTINQTPQFTLTEVADVSKCDSYILPALSLPGAKYYTGANATGSEILAGNVFTSDTTVFAYAETATTPNCFVSESINIQIYNVIKLQDVTICGGYTLPNLADPNANYYAFSGGSGLIAAGTNLTASQTVFVRGTGPSGCTDESNFIVTINGQPIANDASDTVCDNDSSPYDGITPYDLTTLIPTILGTTQAPIDFTVTFFADFNRTIQIIDPTTCTLPVVYVFVTNNLSTTCPSPAIVTITVIPLPDPQLDVPPICIDSETGIVTNSVIESGYNSLQYNIVWTKADGTVVSNSQTFSTDVPGDYILNVASNAVTTCASAPVPFTVIESAKPAVTPPITFDITGWFTNSQTITVNATPYVGDGSNFAYSLDGQTPQDDNVFYNVGPGPHEITVIDKNGCGTRSLPIPVELVNSPAAFTPNGDGINDRWDIKGDISYSTLSIFDRFGRLLKQLNQNSGGWDGTINSQTLPADDYWFSVNYIDSSGAAKEYKSHFSLIR